VLGIIAYLMSMHAPYYPDMWNERVVLLLGASILYLSLVPRIQYYLHLSHFYLVYSNPARIVEFIDVIEDSSVFITKCPFYKP
jgi:hypothetical protein